MIREITRLIAVLSCVVFVFAAFVPVASAAAGVPRIMNYQGRLMSSGGTLLGGSGTDYCVRFSLYDDATVGGPDTKLWPSGSPSTMTVVVRNGIFNAGVGDTGAGGDTLDFNFEDTDTAYLNVEVATKVGATCAPGDGAESFENLSPRQRVTATGYAINSATLNGRTGSFYQANSYSTTSAAYNLSTYDKGYFFSTTSVTYWDAQQYRWATTSTDAWFATKTTDALTEGSSNRYYSNTLVNSFVGASSTIAKAFTNNTFTGTNAFNGDVTLTNATTSNFSITNTIAGAGLVSCSGSSDKLIWNASTRQFGCGADAGAGGGITSLGAQYSVFQTGASQTLATSSDTNIGITITSSGDTHTFTPTWAGLLAAGRGGTGIGTVTQNGVLIGGAGNTWVQAATSSLGLPTYSDLSGYLTRADWYATTTDALAEGATNKYYQDARVQTYLNGVNKGFFFSTTSASNFASVGLAFSTTSTDYWKSQTNFHSTSSFAFNLGTYDKGYFFSTTSVNYWDSTQSRWATTSSDAWLATKSTSNLPEGTNLYYTSNRVAGVIAGTTTDALAEGATNKYYSNGLVNSFIGSSSTIPKTFTNNTFTGTNAFGSVTAANATSTNLYTTFSSSTETRANTASFGSITAGSTTVAATSTTNGLFASFSRMLASFIDSLTASVLTAFTGTVGDLTATSSATLASTTAQGRFILGDLIATSTATSTIAGQLLIGTTSGSYKVSILGNTTGATGATGTAIVAISNNDNTLSSGNNVLRLNARTPFGTTCVTGTTCPRFTEYFTGVPSGSDTGGRGVGSLRLSTAGTGITQTSGAADFAEFMQLSESAAVGDIISLNSSGQYQKAIAGQSLIGVVSDNPAFVGNANLEGQTNAYIVGFAGVIQTTVSAANGTINAGDLIAASNVPGVGVKLTESGYALGQALQSFSGPGQGTITVLVMPKFVDAAVALESYGGGASGTSGYWDLSTSTNTVSLASSTYTVSIGTSASTSNLVVSNGFTFGKASGVLKSVAGVVSSSLVNLASDVTGVLGISNGGTGTSTVPGYGKILVGNGAGGYDLVSTSTLGTGSGSAVWGAITGTLSAQTDLQNALDMKFGLSQWYATTTDALAEGSNNRYFTTNRVAGVIAGTTTDALAEGATNKYYQDSRVQTYLNGVNKGFFFSTTSASNFASVGLAFSTTSTDYWKSQQNFHSTSSFAFNLGTYDKGYFFSTTSVNYWDSTQSRWATTSSDAWLATKSTSNLPEGTNLYYTSNRVAGVIAGTTTDALAEGATNKYYSNGLVQTYLNGVDKGYFFSTTSAAYYGSQNPQAFSTSSANYYVNASSTIPKTYSNNTFTGTNDFQNLTATGVTSTASFATTASSSNLFSAAATIGSIIAKAVTGTVLTATNATTTTLYTDFASTTALNANTANVGSATVGSLTLGNALTGAHGGTGLNTVTQNALLIGGPGNTWTQVATSSLGLVAFGDLGAYMGLAQWYATTTDALAEGSNNRYFTTNRVAAVLAATTTDALAEGATNKYYQDSRVQTFLNTISKGYFFSTTSASNFAAAGLAFSTTSTDFWKSQNNFHSTSSFAYNLSTYDNGSFFSTTSVNYWESTKSRWATTSSDYWLSTKSTSDLPEGTNLYYTSNRVAGVIAGTTTDALAEGATNKYYQDSRVQTYLNGVNKGFFFSTTSSDYWKTQNNFFSTTSASVFSAAGLAFSTTSTDYWKSVNNFFSTTSASHFSSLGLAFSTTSASAFLAQNQGAAFSTTSEDYYQHSSSTVATTYKNNTFTGTNSFQNITATGATTTSLSTGIASTTNLTISGIQNSLLYTGPGGIVAAAGITGPLSFTSGTLALALASSTASGYLSFTDWNSFNSRLSTTSLALFDKGYFFSTTSADAYITASTSIPKLSTNNTFIGVNAFANISATGATTTSFFTGTASSTNIFANVARFGSIGSFSLTGAVAAAANNITGINIASTTDLWISNIRNGLLATNGQGTVVASSTPTAASFNATSNTVASQLPYASTTAISALQQLSIGAANGTILQGAVAGTSTVAGFLNVTGTNSTSTFSGGVSFSRFNVTGTGTSTSAGGINITGGGCFSVNGLCIAAGAVNTVTATNTTLLVNPISGNVGIGLNLSNPNVWTGLQEFVYASSSLQEAAQFFAQTIQSTSTNALVLKSNLSSTAGLTFGSTSTPQVAAIDTINNRFTLGTGGANPSLLVLDTKNTGGDPTGVAGSMYYNSNIGAFRCFNASWVTCGGQAASSTGDVQFRNIDGSFTATSNFNWSMASNGLNLRGASSTQATDLLTISSSSNRTMFAFNGDGVMTLATTTDPATPPSGELNIYAKEIAGRVVPKWVGPAGVDTPFQANLGFNKIVLVASAGAALNSQGATLTNVGTLTAGALAVNTLKQSVRRTTFTSAAGAGSLTSSRSTTALVARGNAAGIGGFFYTIRFGLTTLQSGNRGFFGLSDSTAAATNVDPTTSNVIGKVGLAFNANTGNWKFVQNVAATAPAVIDLGASFPINTTDLMELIMYAKPNDTVINYRITNLSTGAQIASSTGTTNIPANTTFLTIQEWMTNNATAAAVAFDLSAIYLESDN